MLLYFFSRSFLLCMQELNVIVIFPETSLLYLLSLEVCCGCEKVARQVFFFFYYYLFCADSDVGKQMLLLDKLTGLMQPSDP